MTAETHRIDPREAQWLVNEDHDPFEGLLTELDNASELRPDRRMFLRDHADRLREEWEAIDWPTPPTVILGTDRPARCHSDGTPPRLFLRHPLRHGHREWDLIAARWRSDLILGHLHDNVGYTATYASHADVPYGHICAWPDYQVVRDVIVLTEVMSTVRRAHLDVRLQQKAEHQIACLRGSHRRPWNWGR